MSETNEAAPPTEEGISENLAAVRAKLGLNNDGEPVTTDEEVKQVTGQDVDWSEFDLDAKIAHLYPRAVFVPTAEGPKWVVLLDDFYILRAPYQTLGGEIANLVNGPEAWRLQSAVVPAGAITRKQAKLQGGLNYPFGPAGVVTLQRKVRIALPTPMLLKSEKSDAPAAPNTEELKQAEDAALAWIEKEKSESVSEPNTGDTQPVLPPALDERVLNAAEYQPTRQSLVPGALAAADEAAGG